MPFKETQNMDNIPNSSQYKQYVQEGLSSRKLIYRNIILINDSNQERYLAERAPIYIDSNDNVYFRDLILYLREQNLISSGSSLFFFDVERNVFVHQGKDINSSATMIPLKRFHKEEIIIKYRLPSAQEMRGNSFSNCAMNTYQRESMFPNNKRVGESRGYSDFSENTYQINEEEDINGISSDVKAIPREKRVKERKIGYVYDRVQEWRKYYESGVPNENGKIQKVNLDVAASLVGLSRKTLDDYFKYIRKAETFNFNFKERADEKIGVLRNFVRDRQKRCAKGNDNEETVDDFENKSTNFNNNNEDQEEEVVRPFKFVQASRQMESQIDQEEDYEFRNSVPQTQFQQPQPYFFNNNNNDYDLRNNLQMQKQQSESGIFYFDRPSYYDNGFLKEDLYENNVYSDNAHYGAQPDECNFFSNEGEEFNKNIEQEE